MSATEAARIAEEAARSKAAAARQLAELVPSPRTRPSRRGGALGTAGIQKMPTLPSWDAPPARAPRRAPSAAKRAGSSLEKLLGEV